MQLLPPAGEMTWVSAYGFTPVHVDDAEAWCAQQVAAGKVVGYWNGECTVWCDPARDTKRLAHWIEQGVALAPRMVLESKRQFWDTLEFFTEGDLDALATPQWVVEFTPAMRAALEQMSTLMGAIPDTANTTPAELPDLSELVVGSPYLQNQYGKLLAYAGHPAAAGKVFRECIEGAPTYSEPYSNLGTLLWRFGKRREAFVMLTEALLKCPYRVASQLNFIEAGYELEEHGNMIAVLETLVPQLPNMTELRHHLAICCHKLGKTSQAVAVLDALLTQYPADGEAVALRDAMLQPSAGQS